MKLLPNEILRLVSGSNTWGRFVRSFGALSLVRVFGGFLLYIAQVLLASWMGSYAFGRYSYAWAWVAVLSTLAGLGLGNTGVRYIAAYLAEDQQALNRGLQTFGRLALLLSSLCTLAVAYGAVLLWMPTSPYRDPLLLAFIAVPALAFLHLEAAYARGFHWIVLGGVFEQICRPTVLIAVGALIAFYYHGASAEPYVLVCVLAYLSAAIGQHVVVRRRIGRVLGPGPRAWHRSEWMRFSLAMLLLNGSQIVRLNTDLIMVGAYLTPSDLGTYTAALRTSTLVAFVLSVASVAAQPTISAFYAQGRWAELGRFVAQVTFCILGVTLLVGLAVAGLGRFVLGLFGSDYVAGYPALLILIAGFALVAPLGPITSLLIMTGRHYGAAAIHTASIAVNVALNAVFIPLWGIEGAALATASSLCLTNAGLFLVARRALGFSLSNLLRRKGAFGEGQGPEKGDRR